MNPYHLIGKRLREERIKLGYTQEEAAKIVGVRREMWGRYERGSLPKRDTTDSLANAGFDVAYIFTGIPAVARTEPNDLQQAQDNTKASPLAAQAFAWEPMQGTVNFKNIVALLRYCTEMECHALHTLLCSMVQGRMAGKRSNAGTKAR